MRVVVSRFNASIFEVTHPDGKRRAFIKRDDPEFAEALAVEADYNARVARLPFGLGRLIPPTIEMSEARWNGLRSRISGSFPAVKL
ncbi:MAG TPA: hypothetical protein VMV60_07170 [Thermoanaerobaculia bacterium]|nr:hypothetical protein [Thermoanaerobaculia bacterium]